MMINSMVYIKVIRPSVLLFVLLHKMTSSHALISLPTVIDYSLVIAPVVADLCTTPVALSAPPNSYQNNSQS